jgi:nicotinamidase-related amidase
MLATVLDAVDISYRVIVVRDAICSSSDEGHEMLMRLYHTRYTEQIETADAATILAVGMTSDRASSRLGVLIDLV